MVSHDPTVMPLVMASLDDHLPTDSHLLQWLLSQIVGLRGVRTGSSAARICRCQAESSLGVHDVLLKTLRWRLVLILVMGPFGV